jgi:recombination protein RecT
MSKSLAPVKTEELVGYFTKPELDVVINSFAKGATNEELALFVQICQHNGLSPFKNHIYFIKYGNQMSIQIAVEGILHLAQQREDFNGVTSQLVHENDEFELDLDSETQELKITKHSVRIPRGKVAAAYAVAKRKDYPDKVVIIEADEVEHLKKKSGSQWNTYYNDMFKKHALKRALKLQFGIEVDDEYNDASQGDSYQPGERRDITPNQVEVDEGDIIDPEKELKKQWDIVKAKMIELSVTDKQLKELIADQFGAAPKELTLQQVVGLSRMIELKFPKEDKQGAFDTDFEDEDFS